MDTDKALGLWDEMLRLRLEVLALKSLEAQEVVEDLKGFVSRTAPLFAGTTTPEALYERLLSTVSDIAGRETDVEAMVTILSSDDADDPQPQAGQ